MKWVVETDVVLTDRVMEADIVADNGGVWRRQWPLSENKGHRRFTSLGRSMMTSFLHRLISANPDASENHLPADGMEEASHEDNDSFNFIHVLHWIIHIVFVIIFLIIFYK
ncbi:hypothetical protein LXL04_017058 [Taraxacum kok-saghyz]